MLSNVSSAVPTGSETRDITIAAAASADQPPVEYNRVLLELLHDPALIIDPDTNYVIAANARAKETYATPETELAGKHAVAIWKNYEREVQMLCDVMAKGSVTGFDTVHRGMIHSEIVISTNAAAVIFEGRVGVLCINLDVTERKRTKRSIMLANKEWRETIDSVQDMILLEDETGRLRRCNRATADFLGIDYQNAIGRPLTELIKPDMAGNNAFLRQKQWEGTLNRQPRWFEVRNQAVRSETGDGDLWVHVIKDVTENRRAKDELMKLYSVIEQASDATVIVDRNGMIEYVNQVAERLLGCGRESLSGTSITLAKPELAAETLFKEIMPHLRSHSYWRSTYSTKQCGEICQEELTVSKLVDTDGRLTNYVFIFRDVTETRQLESIAEAINLMENVGYIFSGIRHELGNPINSVKMALTVLKKNYLTWDDEQVHLFISRCLQELGRVEYLLRTLKNFSLHESAEIEEVDIADLLQKFCSLAASDLTGRGAEINIEAAAGLRVLCDPRALHQVLINLVANAADALAETSDGRINIKAWATRNRINLLIDDNGPGMTEKQMSNLFKPFYTSKAGGTGLGLVIVRKMLVNMGGTIDIESEQGRGTQVFLTLPAAE